MCSSKVLLYINACCYVTKMGGIKGSIVIKTFIGIFPRGGGCKEKEFNDVCSEKE